MRISEITKSANMSATKICVVALLLFATVVTARTVNKREIISRGSNLVNTTDELRAEEEECSCVQNFISCKKENGTKVCECLYGYKDNGYGVCIECYCGDRDPFLECSYGPNVTKLCVCRQGYLKGRDDMCQKICSADEPCENGGKCENSLCQCLPGTRGDKCEVVEPCTSIYDTWEKCGADSDMICLFNQTSRTSYCGCNKDSGRGYDAQERLCKKKCASDDNCENGGKCVDEVCKCLPGTKGDNCEVIEKCLTEKSVHEMCGMGLTTCKFNQTSLKPYCTCLQLEHEHYGYDAHAKECKECNCGENSTGCTFQENDKDEESDDYVQICYCAPGYAQNNQGQCQACECGENEVCHFEKSKPVCTCKEGFSLKNGKCEGTHVTSTDGTTSSVSSTDGTTSSVSSTEGPTQETVSEKSAQTGWRTSTIVLGILLAICIIGIVFGLYKLRYINYQGVN